MNFNKESVANLSIPGKFDFEPAPERRWECQKQEETQMVLFGYNSKEFIYKSHPEKWLFTKLHIFPICRRHNISNSRHQATR